MGRDDVPEQHVVLEPELGEHAVDDRRARLRRPGAVSWRSEVNGMPLDARAAVAGRLPDEEDGRALLCLEVAPRAVLAAGENGSTG